MCPVMTQSGQSLTLLLSYLVLWMFEGGEGVNGGASQPITAQTALSKHVINSRSSAGTHCGA